jgi:hypothetical protein
MLLVPYRASHHQQHELQTRDTHIEKCNCWRGSITSPSPEALQGHGTDRVMECDRRKQDLAGDCLINLHADEHLPIQSVHQSINQILVNPPLKAGTSSPLACFLLLVSCRHRTSRVLKTWCQNDQQNQCLRPAAQIPNSAGCNLLLEILFSDTVARCCCWTTNIEHKATQET